VTASTTCDDENDLGSSTIGMGRSSRMRCDASPREEDDDVGSVLARELDGLRVVAGLGHDVEARVFERETEIGPNHRVVLHGEHGWSCGLHWSSSSDSGATKRKATGVAPAASEPRRAHSLRPTQPG
jgi:hypothetical protein